ncbi:hypothetical protein [Bdellovibrio sp. HCB337]|uniref:hypothetical protein n=1 Tax=Bdellovibrio sp. HCB337 TaxID=3394358 RepID=UPI0039A75F17
MKDEQDPQIVSNLPRIAQLMRKPKAFVGVLLVYFAVLLASFQVYETDILNFIRQQGLYAIAAIIGIIGFTLFSNELSKHSKFSRMDNFVDVDNKREEPGYFYKKILNELNELRHNPTRTDVEYLESLVKNMTVQRKQSDEHILENFENYFNEIRRVLTEQAHIADTKASILLDKGTSYSRNGIVFYIISIIGWQILALYTEFKEQHIFGIASCSLLFIFIEFLAAWFLKQYRHFVDTSTYLIKVKSIFDKYMLSYLTIKSLSTSTSNEDSKYQAMLNILAEEIRWPESYLMKNADISFAKEAMETMTHFVRSMKKDAKSN